MCLDLCPVAAREACELVECQAVRAHLVERDTAVEQILREPSPRPFPKTTGIDRERIQGDDQRAEATKRWIGLGVKLLGELEVAVEPALRERFREQRAAFLR